MGRITKTFETLGAQKKKALITFIMAGDPNHDTALEIMGGLPDAGADIIELGMPFSDPAADGLTIQHAAKRALENGANMHKTLEMVRNFRQKNDTTPIVLMGYANPLYSYGLEKFTVDASAAGVDGLIIVDLPPEEDGELQAHAKAQGIDIIRLITPTTNEARLKVILAQASGFLYYVSITGVTGAAKPKLDLLMPHIAKIREFTNLPIAIGFGVRSPKDAQEIAAAAEGVVVGSAIIDKIIENQRDGKDYSSVFSFVKLLSEAV